MSDSVLESVRNWVRLETAVLTLLTAAVSGAFIFLWNLNAAVAADDVGDKALEARVVVVEAKQNTAGLTLQSALTAQAGLQSTVNTNTQTLRRVESKIDALLLSGGISYAPQARPQAPKDEPARPQSSKTPRADSPTVPR